jgi:hypothetical protein
MEGRDDIHYDEPASGHRLPHDPFNAIVGPRPIGWISSHDGQGRLNLAPYSFFNAFNYTPPIIGFASIGFKDTVRNIQQTGEFAWSLATRPLAEAMNASRAAHLARRRPGRLLRDRCGTAVSNDAAELAPRGGGQELAGGQVQRSVATPQTRSSGPGASSVMRASRTTSNLICTSSTKSMVRTPYGSARTSRAWSSAIPGRATARMPSGPVRRWRSVR